MTTLLLVRHGETAWNRERRVQGWAPTGLTDRGREQATAAGAWLTERYDVDRAVSSDLRRTRETAARLDEAGEGLPDPSFDRRWRERGFGVYQGFLAEELFAHHPDHGAESVSSLDIAPEGGESIDAFCDRVETAWADLADGAGADETVLVVTHGGPIYFLLSHVRGQDIVTAVTGHSQHNCAINELRVDEKTGAVDVVRHNETV